MKKFIDYLNNFRSVGGKVTNDCGDFNEAGLKIALSNAKVFFNSFSDLLKLSNIDPHSIEKLDFDLPITEIGDLFLKHNSDKSKGHRYDLIYQNIFSGLQFDQLNILEIGLGTNNTNFISNMGKHAVPGASLYAFREFFPNAQIFGADIDKDILFESSRIKTAYVDQLDATTFNNMHETLGKPDLDIFIEDGLHSISASLNSLNYAIKYVKKGGYIILEDLWNCDQIWVNLASLLNQLFDFKYVKLYNAKGMILVIKK